MLLPTELLEDIFGMACTDGGQTACALRAACRTFHQTVDPLRFENVFVTKQARIVALARILKNLPPERRRVRNLHIRANVFEDRPRASKKGWMNRMITKVQDQSDKWNSYGKRIDLEQAMEALCQLCAPTLQNLALHVPDAVDLNYACIFGKGSIIYPLARTLIVGTVTHAFLLTKQVSPCMPSLEHLYLSGWHTFELVLTVLRLSIAAPRAIPHIHVQGQPDRNLLSFAALYMLYIVPSRFVESSFLTASFVHIWPRVVRPHENADSQRHWQHVVAVVQEAPLLPQDSGPPTHERRVCRHKTLCIRIGLTLRHADRVAFG
jgi:hypothetical protein